MGKLTVALFQEAGHTKKWSFAVNRTENPAESMVVLLTSTN